MILFATSNFTQDILLPISITVHFYTLSKISLRHAGSVRNTVTILAVLLATRSPKSI
jgi:hypothetical protein